MVGLSSVGRLAAASVAVMAGVVAVAANHLLQRKHSLLRNYPVLGHLRFLLEGVRPVEPRRETGIAKIKEHI